MKSKHRRIIEAAKKKEIARKNSEDKVKEFNELVRTGLKEAIKSKGYELQEVLEDISRVEKTPKKRNKFLVFFATLFRIRLNNDFETGYWLNFDEPKKRELLLLIISNYNKQGEFVSELFYETLTKDTSFQIVD